METPFIIWAVPKCPVGPPPSLYSNNGLFVDNPILTWNRDTEITSPICTGIASLTSVTTRTSVPLELDRTASVELDKRYWPLLLGVQVCKDGLSACRLRIVWAGRPINHHLVNVVLHVTFRSGYKLCTGFPMLLRSLPSAILISLSSEGDVILVALTEMASRSSNWAVVRNHGI